MNHILDPLIVKTENSSNNSEEIQVKIDPTIDGSRDCETKGKQELTGDKDDPFAYLSRDFTSEKYKIEIRGLPKHYGIGELRKLINDKLKLHSVKIKPPKRRATWLYVCFHSENERIAAIQALNGYLWKRCTLSAQEADAIPDPLVVKRNALADMSKSKYGKKKKYATLKPDGTPKCQMEILKDSTAPLWNVPYEKQLEVKWNKIYKTVKNYGKDLLVVSKRCPKLTALLNEALEKYNGLPCPLEKMRHADVASLSDGYRNKCEFTIGIDGETGLKTIGFRIGAYCEGSTNVAPIDELPQVPARMKELVRVFQEFVRASELSVYDPENHTGYWQQLMAKYAATTDQLMAVIGVHENEITLQAKAELKEKIKQFFAEGRGRECRLTSLYYERMKRKCENNDSNILEHLAGLESITERLNRFDFSISPRSFFQPFTAGAEILYTASAECLALDQNTTLLDVCCGTGSIGITLSKKCGQVLGVESEASAVENARANCLRNNVTNCDFFHGKAEHTLAYMATKATCQNLTAILDPPRAGLHPETIATIRRLKDVKKIVYLSCNAELAKKNFLDLGKPTSKTMEGAPFIPMKAIPVDNFPFSDHCELILYFERLHSN